MSLISSIIYGLKNIGNEGLYPLIELMCSLGWDPINTQDQSVFIEELEHIFIYLYNNENTSGHNKNMPDAHTIIHHQLHEALKTTLQKDSVDLFHSSLERFICKRYMHAFSKNFKNILKQHPEGLKKSLILYTEMYHIMRTSHNTLHSPEDLPHLSDDSKQKIKDAVTRCKTYAKHDFFKNSNQFKQFMLDRKCREILTKDLFHSDSQLKILAERILQDTNLKLFEKTISRLNQYILEENFSIGTSETYQELVTLIHKIFNNHENTNHLSMCLNELANLPLVQKNEKLRAFLGEHLAVKTKIEQEPSDILKCYDNKHDLLFFKPDLVKRVQEKLELEVLLRIKSDFSSRIYKNDGLIENYLPINMRGINTTNSLNGLLYSYNSNGKLLPIGILNEIYHSYKGGHHLYLIFNAIIRDFSLKQKFFSPI